MNHIEHPHPSKVYVIGASDGCAMEIASRINSIHEGALVVFVDKIEDVPEDELPKSNPFQRESIPFIFNKLPDMPPLITKRRVKGHERDYKYHK